VELRSTAAYSVPTMTAPVVGQVAVAEPVTIFQYEVFAVRDSKVFVIFLFWS
jgi:hypothetical protein